MCIDAGAEFEYCGVIFGKLIAQSNLFSASA